MIYGFGINDVYGDSINGSENKKIYQTWYDMIKRCYSKSYQEKHSSYKGVIISDEWRKYSKFKEWYINNYITGYQLDKDIIGGAQKIYSPKTCAFVPTEINYSILDGETRLNSPYPFGVSHIKKAKNALNERKKPYQSCIYINKNKKFLGYHETSEDAHLQWQKEKVKYFEELVAKYHKDVKIEVIDGLKKRIDILKSDIANNRITETINKI